MTKSPTSYSQAHPVFDTLLSDLPSKCPPSRGNGSRGSGRGLEWWSRVRPPAMLHQCLQHHQFRHLQVQEMAMNILHILFLQLITDFLDNHQPVDVDPEGPLHDLQHAHRPVYATAHRPPASQHRAGPPMPSLMYTASEKGSNCYVTSSLL